MSAFLYENSMTSHLEAYDPQSSLFSLEPGLAKAVASLILADSNRWASDYLKSVAVPTSDLSESKVPTPSKPIDMKQLQYTRPNGDIYYSRAWLQENDVEVLKKAREAGMFALLYGPPGTGKTALTEAAFGDELITVVLTGDTEVSDLVGSFVPKTDGTDGFEWVDGPLTVAVSEGRPLLMDEIGLGDPKVLSILYGAMDGRREINVTANPSRGVIKSAPGFYVIGATNPHAPGVRLSEALLSRFSLHVEITTDWALAIKLGVPERIVRLAETLANQVAEGSLTWAPQFRELLMFRDVEAKFGRDFAVANLLAICPETDRDQVQEVVNRTVGKRILPARI